MICKIDKCVKVLIIIKLYIVKVRNELWIVVVMGSIIIKNRMVSIKEWNIIGSIVI